MLLETQVFHFLYLSHFSVSDFYDQVAHDALEFLVQEIRIGYGKG